MTKQEIRTNMKELKKRLPISDIQLYSNDITRQLLNTTIFKQCTQLFCYVSFNQEVDTATIMNTALSQRKQVAVPKIIDDEMKFYYIKSLDDLKPGILGILEPSTGEEAIPSNQEICLFLVPGLAFDISRNRIGYGKGYYDYYFTKQKAIPAMKIALAYDFQVLEELPVEIHDKPIDEIITQTRVIK